MPMFKTICQTCGWSDYQYDETEARRGSEAHEHGNEGHLSPYKQMRWKVVCDICGGMVVSHGHTEQDEAQASASAHYESVGQSHGPQVVEEE